MSQPYGCPGRLSTSANLKPAPTDHTHAIAEAAREYVATQRCFSDDEFKPADVRRAVEAHKALYAAVDAERADREPGCTCVRCAPNYHLMRGRPTCGNPDHLRAVSASENARNRAEANANSTSGARGVWWHGERGRWVAQVGRLRQAGFETKVEAEAYVMGAHAALGWVTTTGGQP